jgi:hypothetical protein
VARAAAARDDGEVTTLAVIGAIAVLLALVGLAVWRLARRIRQVLLAWHEVYLNNRVRWLPPGPQREAGMLRQRLHHELACTTAMLNEAPAGMIFRADARAVLQEITEMATAVERDLRAIERFADATQQRAALTVVAPQARQLIETSYSARQTILRTSAEDRDRQMARLRAQVDQQEAAARVYRHGGRDLIV